MAGIGETAPDGTVPAPVIPQQVDVRSALHPFENSRLILALSASLVTFSGAVALIVGSLGLLGTFFLGLLLGGLVVLVWVGLQVQRARLLGNSIVVDPGSVPDVYSALATVRRQLAYNRRVDVYIAAEVSGKATWLNFLGHRVILLEGDFVADLLSVEGQAGLRFLIGSFIGAFKARHARLLPIILLLQIFDSVKFLILFLMPYLRATRYSGDQIGYLCSGDLKVAINVVGRLLVGKDVAPGLGVGGVLDQVAIVQVRLLPRFTQFFTQTPHLVNRYMNVLAFSARVAPRDFLAFAENLSEGTRQHLDLLLSANPHTKRRPPGVQPQPPKEQARRVDRLIVATVSAVVVAVFSLVLFLLNVGGNGKSDQFSPTSTPVSTGQPSVNTVIPASPYTVGDLFNMTDNGNCGAVAANVSDHTVEAISCNAPPYVRYFYKYQDVDADGWVAGIRSGTTFTNLTPIDETNSCYKSYIATYRGGDGVLYNTVLFVYRKTPFVVGRSGDARSVDFATLVNTKFYVKNINALC